GDVGFGGQQVEEVDHHLLGVDQPLVHVDVDDLGAVLYLVARHFEGGRVVAGGDQPLEAGGAGDIGALPDIDEGDLGREREWLQPGEAQHRLDLRHLSRLVGRDDLGEGADVVGRRAAATADDIDEAFARELL